MTQPSMQPTTSFMASTGYLAKSPSLAVALVATSLGLLCSCAASPMTMSPGTTGSGGDVGAGGTSGGGTGGSSEPAGPRNPGADHGQLRVVGTQLQDAAGSPVQLKGVSSMWLNWESHAYAESKSALEYARDNWKVSVIRAAMGVEAQNGYLTTPASQALMLSKVDTIVQNAIDLGLYVIVDWHTGKATTQQADAVAFFTALAGKYGDLPNIIYEPYNEPTGVTWAQIKPYHQAVVAAIRAVDPDNLIILGTPNFSQDVDVAAQDKLVGTNLMYTLHFYACTHKQPLRDKGTRAMAMGAPLFITEFGATPADGGVVKSGDPYVCDVETNSWFTWMATNNISGAAWKLEQCTDTSCILTSSAPVDGPWTDDVLTGPAGTTAIAGGFSGGGHGQLVVGWLRQ